MTWDRQTEQRSEESVRDPPFAPSLAQDGERVAWHSMANRGADNTCQVGEVLYLTDERLFFEPALLERATEEKEWQAPLADLSMTLGPRTWDSHIPVVRHIALRYHLQAIQADGSVEDFWITQLGEPLEQIAHWDAQSPT
jgi:hypothetical protein